MNVKPLVRLATEAAIHGIRKIDDIGEIPYHIVQPILLRIGSPEQLRQLEITSPHLVGQDEQIWVALLKRIFPDWDEQRHRPKNPSNWYKVFRILKREADAERAEYAAALKVRLDEQAAEKESNTVTLDSTLQVTKRAKVLPFGSDSKSSSGRMVGRDLLSKARREAREATHNHGLLLPSRHRVVAHPMQRKSSSLQPAAQAHPAGLTTPEDASKRRERALALHRATTAARSSPLTPKKRPRSSIFMPSKRRKL